MLQKTLSVLFLFAMFVGSAFGETCPPATYTVTYSCGNGTVVGALPPDATATYGKSFTPTMLTKSHCNAPSGYHQVGIEIWDANGDIGGYALNVSAFTYYYTSGITIRPHYVADGSDGVLLWNLRGENGVSHKCDSAAMTWSVEFAGYGTVSGIAACSSVGPQNTAYGDFTGYIADDQSAIKDKERSGRYCYCKMTEPYFAGSPWVFNYDHNSGAYCASGCAYRCAPNVQSSAVFRGSVFRGARPN